MYRWRVTVWARKMKSLDPNGDQEVVEFSTSFDVEAKDLSQAQYRAIDRVGRLYGNETVKRIFDPETHRFSVDAHLKGEIDK